VIVKKGLNLFAIVLISFSLAFFASCRGSDGIVNQTPTQAATQPGNTPTVNAPEISPTGEMATLTPPRISPISTIPTASPAGENKNNLTEMKGEKMIDLEIKSTAFNDGEMIPKKYTGDGLDVSPPLSWNPAPEGTKSLVIICYDINAPSGNWDHWVLFDIPANMTSFPEGVPKDPALPDGSIHGKNGWGRPGYKGPAPPPGKPHRYFFKIFALDKILNMGPLSERKVVEKGMEGHILATGKLLGLYGR
jgi:Raf kinase inhibitor-like YbhB/YbcL family protein